MADSTKKKAPKRSSLLVMLMLSIGATIIAFSTLQIVIVVAEARKDIVKDETKVYEQLVDTFRYALANDIWGYKQQLNFYLESDVFREGSFDEMVTWLRAHEAQRSEDYDYIMLAGPSGIAYTDINTSTNIATREYFQAIMNQGKDFYVDNPVISKTTGKPVIHITRAIKRNGKNIAMLAGVVTVTDFTEEIAQFKIGKTGYAWMLASDGLVIQHPREDFIMNKNFITGLSAGFEDMAAVATNIAAGRTGSQWVNGLNGGKDLIVYTGIDETPWGLALTVPQNEIYDLVDKIKNRLTLFGAISMLATIIVGAVLLYFTIQPLTVVKNTIQGIATGNADLTKRIKINSNNEIGQVVQGFNQFSEKLQEIIRDVKESKNNLSIAGEDMTASTQDTASAITQIIANIESMQRQIIQQNDSVHQTAGAVNEIASNITSLENMIESQSSGVTQASAAVEEMIGNIKSVNQSMDKMANEFNLLQNDAQQGFNKQQDVNERIKQIESQSEMLQEANAAISAIAEQTNLLAMNAAIEAAHAGEAGKGFSVVADEIRKLSETSTSQSKTIGEQLNNIKDSIQEVVSASAESSKAFESVSHKIEATDQLVMQIKAAMEEQNTGSQQISEALHSMNDSTIQVRNAAQEMTEGNKAILEEVRNLQDATGAMKDSMEEMSTGARKINETGAALEGISSKVKDSISKIGAQIDQFKV